MYCDLENAIYFQFFMIQFFPSNQKMTIQKQCKTGGRVFYLTEKEKFFGTNFRNDFDMNVLRFMGKVLLLLYVH